MGTGGKSREDRYWIRMIKRLEDFRIKVVAEELFSARTSG